jgi:hypothetical protein
MKESKYSMVSRGRTSEMFGSFVALLSGRGSLSLRFRGSLLSPGEGFDLVMSLRSHGTGKGPTSLH